MKKAEQLVFDEDIYNTIRRNIKKYRNEKGLTSAQLAEIEFTLKTQGRVW